MFFLVTWFFLVFVFVRESVINWSLTALVGTAAYLAEAQTLFPGNIHESAAKSGDIDCAVYYYSRHNQGVLTK
jgi:hypothetical protein